MSNFIFIKADFPNLFQDAAEAEKLLSVSPSATAIFCRSSLENAINWLYDHDDSLKRPWRSDLNSLLHEYEFQKLFTDNTFRELNLLRKIGNLAAHGSRIGRADALASLKYLFRFLRHLAIYYGKQTPKTERFDDSKIPESKESDSSGKDQKQLKKLLEKLEYKNSEARKAEEKIREQAQHNATLRRQLEQAKEETAVLKRMRETAQDLNLSVPLEISEAETRRRYIDLSLKECGWDQLRKGRELEYPVTGMPLSTNPSGRGAVDYVLWDDDGLPLALIEAKKCTWREARQGKQQAKLYADCLERQHGQRPIIFYSNGFETYLWDDRFYPERQVQGFYKKEELQRLIARRQSRSDLRAFKTNPEIIDRAYQLEAVARVAENSVATVQGELRGRRRKSLLVMATGSGKTRTAAALVEMFSKCNWVKRVLFLADRNALVSQAKNAFSTYLPHLSAINLSRDKYKGAPQLVFSTYQGMMNRIDGMWDDRGGRTFGIGHFDLIIVDEAHRSIYQKYSVIFAYFDALLVGLTATPKTEVDHNTYGLFGIEDDNPTFAYELHSAVKEGYLVPPQAISVPLQFVREGIFYHKLSKAEQEQYEEKFGDPESDEVADQISSSALNSWLFNSDTVDKVLAHLMEYGLKVAGGDRLGKSIIFAKNHQHALFIEARFNANYPEYSGEFLRVIDNYESKAQDLLENFTDEHRERSPQIAVSVDMMDTGVDAPRVVNLVFFKAVKSVTKFWQMIGRGTRLCPDLFGLGEDKSCFQIFDFCQNFEFFGENPAGVEGSVLPSLTARIFVARLALALAIRQHPQSNAEQRALAEALIVSLQQAVAQLDRERFVVKAHLRAVVEYGELSRWQNLSSGDAEEINGELADLILLDDGDDEFARRFDLLMLNYQLALLAGSHSTEKYLRKVTLTATALLKKQNIPAVAQHVPLLQRLQGEAFWQQVTLTELESVRVALRELLKYLDRENQTTVVTEFEDHLELSEVAVHDLVAPSYQNLQSYQERVSSYVRDHADHLVIQKLQRNKPITATDLNSLEAILFDEATVGSQQEYREQFGDKPLGELIRSIVGLEANAAQAVFAGFLQASQLRADQMSFIQQIIDYLSKNGVIDKSLLFEAPFTHLHDQGLFGVFGDAEVVQLMGLIDRVNENAQVGVAAVA